MTQTILSLPETQIVKTTTKATNRLVEAIGRGIDRFRVAKTTEAKKPITAGSLRPVAITLGDTHMKYEAGRVTHSSRLKPEVQDRLEMTLKDLASVRDDAIGAATSEYDRAIAAAREAFEAQLEHLSQVRDTRVTEAEGSYQKAGFRAMTEAFLPE